MRPLEFRSNWIWTYPNTIYLNLSKPIRTYPYLSEIIWTYLNLFEPIWTYSNLSEPFWTYLNLSEPIQTYLSLLEPIQTYLNLAKNYPNLSEYIRTFLNLAEPCKTYSNLSKPILTNNPNLSKPFWIYPSLSEQYECDLFVKEFTCLVLYVVFSIRHFRQADSHRCINLEEGGGRVEKCIERAAEITKETIISSL